MRQIANGRGRAYERFGNVLTAPDETCQENQGAGRTSFTSLRVPAPQASCSRPSTTSAPVEAPPSVGIAIPPETYGGFVLTRSLVYFAVH